MRRRNETARLFSHIQASAILGTDPAIGILIIAVFAGPAQSATFMTGDIFVAVSDPQTFEAMVQWYRPAQSGSPTLIGTLDTQQVSFATGMAFDAFGNLYVTTFDSQTVTKFGTQGNRIGTFGSNYDCMPESIVFDAAGNAYVGQSGEVEAPGCTKNILKFDAAGTFLARFSVATEDRGSDWLDLAPSGCTLYYTSEGQNVLRFDAAAKTQLSQFNAALLPGPAAYALALLPDGGLLVADTDQIVRLDALGVRIKEYAVGQGNLWFSLSLDPDGTSFWAADMGTAKVYKFDLATGAQLLPSPLNTGTGPFTVFGLAVFGLPAGQKGRGCPRGPEPTATGWMTGGGSVFTTGGTRVTHGFELHCDVTRSPNNLEVNWGTGNRFHLEKLTVGACSVDPTINPNPPNAGFNTYHGVGTGSYNGVSGYTAEWIFTDAGEPGKKDKATLTITDSDGNPVLTVSGDLTNGNQQAHKN